MIPDQLVMNIEIDPEHLLIFLIWLISTVFRLLQIMGSYCKITCYCMFKHVHVREEKCCKKKKKKMGLISAQENVKMETKTETLKCLGVIKEDGVLVIGED